MRKLKNLCTVNTKNFSLHADILIYAFFFCPMCSLAFSETISPLKQLFFISHQTSPARATSEIYFLNAPVLETSVEVLEKRIASVHHYSDCSAINSHTRGNCVAGNFSNCRPLNPFPVFPLPPPRNTFPRSYGAEYWRVLDFCQSLLSPLEILKTFSFTAGPRSRRFSSGY